MEDVRYQSLLETVKFLNVQMTRFESMIEIENAEMILMQNIGEFVGADCAQLIIFQDGTFVPRCHWLKNENVVYRNYEESYTIKEEDTWLEELQKGKVFYLQGISDWVAYDGMLSSHLKDFSCEDLYVLPLCHENLLDGVVCFYNPNENRLHSFMDVQNLFSSWLANRIAKKDNRMKKIMSGLGRDYTAAFMINLDTDYFEVLINQKANNAAKEKKQFDWNDYLHNYADKYCVESSIEPMKKELCTETVRERLKNVEEYHFTFETVPNDIGQKTFQAHIAKEYGPKGNYVVIGFRCVDQIVEREREYQKSLDEAYKEARQQLEIITNAIPGGIKISNDDETYSFRYVSKQYIAMLGYDNVDEFMKSCGGSIAGIAHPDDLESGIAEALKQYQTSDHYEITYRMRCKDGSYKYIEDHGHKVYTPEGKVEHWNLILDKNELVEKTIALESEKKANLAKTQFLSRMSHDIRTPLNGIIGLLQLNDAHGADLRFVRDNEKKAEVAANHLQLLVNDILELNKLSDQDVVLYEEPFCIADLIHEVMTISSFKADEAGVILEMRSNKEKLEYPYLMGSPLHIQRIFINIINNAIKYNHKGGLVSCYLEEGKAVNGKVTYRVRIMDTGIGMDKKFISTIYEPFTQEKQDARSVYQGTGLGLSIVKNLVDRMHGSISIQSEVNKGTCVEVTLSFKTAEKPVNNRSKTDSTGLAGKHVLLAEDNGLNREIVRSLLLDENMQVTEVRNGKEAVEMYLNADAHTFDIILMDVMMPVMDGISATHLIRTSSKEDAESIPVFALTANAFVEDRKKCTDAGMNEHIAKPINKKELIQKMSSYLL